MCISHLCAPVLTQCSIVALSCCWDGCKELVEKEKMETRRKKKVISPEQCFLCTAESNQTIQGCGPDM